LAGEGPPLIPARFCLEFVDLASFTTQHRQQIGRTYLSNH
jgi:hypothetical protein